MSVFSKLFNVKFSRLGRSFTGTTLVFASAVVCTGISAQTLTNRADALLAKWDGQNTPGVAVVLIRDARVLYRKDVGMADLERHTRINPNTQFLIGSMTKQFTAMAVMILKDRGKLRFEDSLAMFCPEFPPYARTITIRHLLNHTSGLPDYEELLLGKVDYDKLLTSSKGPRAAHEFTSAEALQVLSRQKTLGFSPGAKWEYSNSGYAVLAQIVERVSGKRYAEFLKETIFDPLGMHDTLVVDERRQDVPRLATGYGKRNGTWQNIMYSPVNFIYGEDGIYSTVNDLFQWDQALYTDRLVQRSTLQMAFAPGHTNDGKETDTYLTGILKRPTSYGFGWFLMSLNGTAEMEHGGFWSGYRSYIIREPARRITAIVLMNSADDDVRLIAQGLIDAAGH